jgi:hypothetical protein
MLAWIVAWVIVPVVIVALSAGIGLLAERCTRTRLSWPTVVAVGACGLVVLSTLLTTLTPTAPLATPALVIVSLAGWTLARPAAWTRTRRPWPVLSAVAVFACYAAPVALSGAPTWAGFVKLDDTPDWMALADRLVTVGRSTQGLAHSTFGVLIPELFDGGYPVGAFADLGVVSRLVGQDSAWVVQPLMATLAGILCLALYAVSAPVVRSARWRAVVAFVAASSTLLLGYTLWGGLKEITLALMVATCCAVMVQGRDDRRPLLGQVGLLAIAMSGVYAVFGVAGAVYLVPVAVVELVLVLRWFGRRATLPAVGVFSATFLALSIPALVLLPAQVSGAVAFTASAGNDIGNLYAPLKFVQVFGVWLTGDFRVSPSSPYLTLLLILLVVLGAAGGVAIAVRCRLPALPVLVVTNLAVSFYYVFGNAWLEGKTLAVASPSMLLAAGVGFAWLAEHGRRPEGMTLMALVGAGVLASNLMAYREVWIAPADRMHELASIGASDLPSPALMLEYDPAAARHFLSRLDAEAAGEFRWNLIPMYDGQGLGKGAYADIDDFPVSSITAYRTLVLRNDLVGSRPPSSYRLARAGAYYDVWTVDPAAPTILEHWPLGDHADPATDASCATVRQAAARAGSTGRIASAARPPLITVALSQARLPSGWSASSVAGAVDATTDGSVTTTFSAPTAGTYRADLGGSVYGSVRVLIDGTELYSDHGRLNWTPYANPMPSVRLAAGRHTVRVEYSTTWLPGGGFTPSTLGPVVLSEAGADVPVTYTPTKDALKLCGQRLDWIEAVAG